jgi:hypothetical protein
MTGPLIESCANEVLARHRSLVRDSDQGSVRIEADKPTEDKDPYVRFGSKADVEATFSDVCFAPTSGHFVA